MYENSVVIGNKDFIRTSRPNSAQWWGHFVKYCYCFTIFWPLALTARFHFQCNSNTFKRKKWRIATVKPIPIPIDSGEIRPPVIIFFYLALCIVLVTKSSLFDTKLWFLWIVVIIIASDSMTDNGSSWSFNWF